LSAAYGVSRDAQIIVGFARDGCGRGHAFRREPSTGMTDLGSSVADHASLAAGVSGDGHVVVGYQEAATGYRPSPSSQYILDRAGIGGCS
jgi:probable HAF family extracellular repeat protein